MVVTARWHYDKQFNRRHSVLGSAFMGGKAKAREWWWWRRRRRRRRRGWVVLLQRFSSNVSVPSVVRRDSVFMSLNLSDATAAWWAATSGIEPCKISRNIPAGKATSPHNPI